MKGITVKFEYKGKKYRYKCPFRKLDRNYPDEEYAYFLRKRKELDYGFFEVNILKNPTTMQLICKGYVAVYDNLDHTSLDDSADCIVINISRSKRCCKRTNV